MLNPAHKNAFLQALDGVDMEIDRLTLGVKQKTQAARAAADEQDQQEPQDEPEPQAETDAEMEEPSLEEEERAPAPPDRIGPSDIGGFSRKPLFGKRFAR